MTLSLTHCRRIKMNRKYLININQIKLIRVTYPFSFCDLLFDSCARNFLEFSVWACPITGGIIKKKKVRNSCFVWTEYGYWKYIMNYLENVNAGSPSNTCKNYLHLHGLLRTSPFNSRQNNSLNAILVLNYLAVQFLWCELRSRSILFYRKGTCSGLQVIYAHK